MYYYSVSVLYLEDLKTTLVKGAKDMIFPVEKKPEVGHAVPEKIHFVWIGLSKDLPEKYTKHIVQFKKVNPCYDVFLWTNLTFAEEMLSFFA